MSEDRCPECGGTGRDDSHPYRSAKCPACGGTGKKGKPFTERDLAATVEKVFEHGREYRPPVGVPGKRSETPPAAEARSREIQAARHGRGDFFGDHGGGEQDHSCHAGCPCQRRKFPAEKLGGPVKTQVDLPDEVRYQALYAADSAVIDTPARTNADVTRVAVAAAAPVLIEHGRQQERERIKSLIEARAREAADDYRRDPDAYHRGREDELLMVADEIREGENGE